MSNSLDWSTPVTVEYWEYTPGGPDPHRNPPTYFPPLDEPGTPVQVYGWAIPSATAPHLAGHPDREVADGDLYMPVTFAPPARSVIGLPAGRFTVGAVQDYNHGPFEWAPGNVSSLRKVDG